MEEQHASDREDDPRLLEEGSPPASLGAADTPEHDHTGQPEGVVPKEEHDENENSLRRLSEVVASPEAPQQSPQVSQEPALYKDGKVDEEGLINILFDTELSFGTAPTNRVYPEAILQSTDHGYKYYNDLQRYTAQLLKDDGTNSIVRWTDSYIERTQRAVVTSWVGSTTTDTTTDSGHTKRAPLSSANKLFKWASSDAYVERIKREFQAKKGLIEGGSPVNENSKADATEKPKETNQSTTIHLLVINAERSRKVTKHLKLLIEREAKKFIHARIQKQKLQLTEEINQQIHERKRKDHELHLMRLKLKEEEYEREMQAASEKSTGFFKQLNFWGTSTSKKRLGEIADTLPASETVFDENEDEGVDSLNEIPEEPKKTPQSPLKGFGLFTKKESKKTEEGKRILQQEEDSKEMERQDSIDTKSIESAPSRKSRPASLILNHSGATKPLGSPSTPVLTPTSLNHVSLKPSSRSKSQVSSPAQPPPMAPSVSLADGDDEFDDFFSAAPTIKLSASPSVAATSPPVISTIAAKPTALGITPSGSQLATLNSFFNSPSLQPTSAKPFSHIPLQPVSRPHSRTTSNKASPLPADSFADFGDFEQFRTPSPEKLGHQFIPLPVLEAAKKEKTMADLMDIFAAPASTGSGDKPPQKLSSGDVNLLDL